MMEKKSSLSSQDGVPFGVKHAVYALALLCCRGHWFGSAIGVSNVTAMQYVDGIHTATMVC